VQIQILIPPLPLLAKTPSSSAETRLNLAGIILDERRFFMFLSRISVEIVRVPICRLLPPTRFEGRMASRADPAVEVAAVVTDESDTLIHDVVDDDTALVVVPATMDDAAATSESNQRKKVNQRWVLSDEAKRALEAVYNERRFPTLAMREELAQELGGSLRQVQVWFQNRRQRDHRPDDEATLSTGTTAMAVGGSVQPMWGFMPGHPYPLGAIPMPSMQAHPLGTLPMFPPSAGGASAFSVQHGPQYPGGLTPGPGGSPPQLSHPILSMNNHLYQALAQRPPSTAAGWTAQQRSTAALRSPQPSHPQCLHPPSVMASLPPLPPLPSLSSLAPQLPGQPRTALGTALASHC